MKPTTSKSLLTLTAEELMTRDVVTIPQGASLPEAAKLLRSARVGGAPVVDEQGRCVGVLSAVDYLRWTEDGCPMPIEPQNAGCSFQVRGRLLTGQEAVICTLAEGSCPLQRMVPTTQGRHTALCVQPRGVHCDWQQVIEPDSGDGVSRYMTRNLVTASPETPLVDLVRMMIDAQIHRIPIVDERGRPIGMVTSTDVLAAMMRCQPE